MKRRRRNEIANRDRGSVAGRFTQERMAYRWQTQHRQRVQGGGGGGGGWGPGDGPSSIPRRPGFTSFSSLSRLFVKGARGRATNPANSRERRLLNNSARPVAVSYGSTAVDCLGRA